MSALSMITKGQGDRTDRGHPQGSGKGWRPWKPQCTVAVTGVTERTKKTSLQEAFGEFGRIIRIEVPNGKTVAFVEYEEKRDANDAIADMNGKAVEGRRISVKLVEDLPPKIDRGVPREEARVVHAPAEGRTSAPWFGVRKKDESRNGRRGKEDQSRQNHHSVPRSPRRRRSPSRRGRRSQSSSGGRRKRSRNGSERSKRKVNAGSTNPSRRLSCSRSRSSGSSSNKVLRQRSRTKSKKRQCSCSNSPASHDRLPKHRKNVRRPSRSASTGDACSSRRSRSSRPTGKRKR